ncbi:helix-turn-helix transcriptional regulator [Dokdonia sp.]|uniref:helix-turn-helix domain-containing protein n=1 Tax=Dokdonia sp. TaxID=2024995 RepID=UPI003267F676
MNKQPSIYPSGVRKAHHLKINDLAYLLEMDQSSLSRFEAGKFQSLKALIGYHILLNLSIESSIRQVFEAGFKGLSDRCFQLIEKVSEGPKTLKNTLRLESLNNIVTRLMQLDEAYV